jgi:hypothetical protein
LSAVSHTRFIDPASATDGTTSAAIKIDVFIRDPTPISLGFFATDDRKIAPRSV